MIQNPDHHHHAVSCFGLSWDQRASVPGLS